MAFKTRGEGPEWDFHSRRFGRVRDPHFPFQLFQWFAGDIGQEGAQMRTQGDRKLMDQLSLRG